jgi:hypothetical protein
MNGLVRAGADRFEAMHSGKGFGIRNAKGGMLLEFADAMGLAVCNTWFTNKKDSQKVTYEQVAATCKTAVDYALIRREKTDGQ